MVAQRCEPASPEHADAESDEDVVDQRKHYCYGCSKVSGPDVKLPKCTGCKVARYCGHQRQKEHWRLHRTDCASLRTYHARPEKHVATSLSSHMSFTNPRCKKVFEVPLFTQFECPFYGGRAEAMPFSVTHQSMADWKDEIKTNYNDGVISDGEYVTAIHHYQSEKRIQSRVEAGRRSRTTQSQSCQSPTVV